ncbi:DNA-3-methyladenine glycosylase I [Gluconacetobacter liquefaciens NRIC 0522]|uniref:DNA-3-methyladenine glycosylase I n=1 Tax=Gluconacetobacter liquefaciens TaxID=89584 RepID=A0A370G6E2_GLULI|nr:DNA-3-methyladenine glycosylase I [Gluconacetobacter liquefaciens]MBB2185577.1 DNA-3-methyladenine glycosylase I [Gluconacetobacter liquefaciens]RDI39382.1 DNA-3-methyladenine glycosylase I [Gluconacetobacter liquefaciens]GBQ97647.1 DNA-3-methyladenine glycosylase I [Gluconacetobacter liquefaciens NRIC 0522]
MDDDAVAGTPAVTRCRWAQTDPLLRAYHDQEWGVPVHDSRMLWEMLCLEGFQAGLSWLIVLRRREGFRRAFVGFDPERVARFGAADVERLMADPGIIRARAKIEATIGNARAYLAMMERGEDFADFAWGMVPEAPVRNMTGAVLAQSPLSQAMAKALKARGFRFVGPVIVYAWMQAVGMIDDHDPACFRHSR